MLLADEMYTVKSENNADPTTYNPYATTFNAA